MHVAWVNQSADFVGGAERYIADMAPRLAERGIRSSLLYGVDGWMEPTFTSRFEAAFPMVDLEAQLRALKPDLVYIHQLADEAVLEPIIRSSIPTFRFLHDHKLLCLREHKYKTLSQQTCTQRVGLGCYRCLGFVQKHNGIRLQTVSSLEKKLAMNRRLSGVIVGSEYMRQHCLLHDFAPAKVHAARLYVETDGVPEPVTRRDDLLVFVGALLRGKGLDILLDAMTRLPKHVRLRVLGSGAQEGTYRESVRDLALADRVHFVGQADSATVKNAYSEAACVVVPSRSPETFSFVGPEALLHGAPVVASNVGGMGEWLNDGDTALAFETCNAASLAESLRSVLADPAAARAMAQRGHDWVRERLTADQHTRMLISIFRDAVSSQPGLRREAHR